MTRTRFFYFLARFLEYNFFACFWTNIFSNFPELVYFSPPTHTQRYPIPSNPTYIAFDTWTRSFMISSVQELHRQPPPPICCSSSRSGGVGMLCTFGSRVYSAQPQISSCFLHPPARHMGPEWGKNRLLPLTRLLTTSTTSTTSTTEWR